MKPFNAASPPASPLQAIATRMSSELVAFQRQRAEELSAVLRRFATLVAAGEGAAAKTWAPLARGADA